MSSLLVVVDLILAIFLEKTTRKNNRNSSLPSSQRDKDETAVAHGIEKDKGRKGRDQQHANKGNLRLYQGLAVWEAGAIERILQAPSVHVDETS